MTLIMSVPDIYMQSHIAHLTLFFLHPPQLAIKTGYDKFLSVALDGSISGRSEAIGAREEFQISFDDGFQVC